MVLQLWQDFFFASSRRFFCPLLPGERLQQPPQLAFALSLSGKSEEDPPVFNPPPHLRTSWPVVAGKSNRRRRKDKLQQHQMQISPLLLPSLPVQPRREEEEDLVHTFCRDPIHPRRAKSATATKRRRRRSMRGGECGEVHFANS